MFTKLGACGLLQCALQYSRCSFEEIELSKATKLEFAKLAFVAFVLVALVAFVTFVLVSLILVAFILGALSVCS